MTRLDGIDVSHYQGHVDWHAAAAAGIWWGAAKATQSISYLDPTFTTNRLGMFSAGLRHRGLYHWLDHASDPFAQANWYLTKIGQLDVGEFALLDAEEVGITVSEVLQWCSIIEAHTLRPVAVYSGAYVAAGSIWTDPRVRTSPYGPRPMALAAYVNEAAALALPGVATHPWDSWQFTSGASAPYVPTRFDGNRVDHPAAYDLAAGLNQPPAPTPTPAEEEDSMDIVTNSETFLTSAPNVAKFVVKSDGSLRHITYTEWVARGSLPGNPLTNAQILELGAS